MSKLGEYRGISYPVIFQNRLMWWLWKRTMCSREKHLFDESLSLDDHCLYCDACGLTVYIDRIIEEEEDVRQYKEYNDH